MTDENRCRLEPSPAPARLASGPASQRSGDFLRRSAVHAIDGGPSRIGDSAMVVFVDRLNEVLFDVTASIRIICTKVVCVFSGTFLSAGSVIRIRRRAISDDRRNGVSDIEVALRRVARLALACRKRAGRSPSTAQPMSRRSRDQSANQLRSAGLPDQMKALKSVTPLDRGQCAAVARNSSTEWRMR